MARGKRKKPVQAAPPTPPSGVTYETESSGFFGAVDRGESAQWEQGHYWSNLVTYRLYSAAGYKSALIFLKKEARKRNKRVPPAAELSQWATVAEAFEEPLAARYGMDALLRLLRIRERNHRPGNPGDPADELIDVPQKGGRVLKKRFADCTEKDLKEALKAPAPKKKSPPPRSPEGEALFNDLIKAVGSSGVLFDVEPAGTTEFTVTVHGNSDAIRQALRVERWGELDANRRWAAGLVQDELALKSDRESAGRARFVGYLTDLGTVAYDLTGVSEAGVPHLYEVVKNKLKAVLANIPPKAPPAP